MFALRPPERVNLAGQSDEQLARDHLSHTSLGVFLGCQQKYQYDYERRLAPAVTPEPLAMGRAFAHGVEHASPEAAEAYLREQAAKEAERAAGNPWIATPGADEVTVQATVVREASRAYLRQYGSHPAREIEMRARIRNPAVGGRYSLSHDLVGRVDALDLDSDGGVLYEDKLVGKIPRTDLSARVALDRQVSIGCYLIWRTTGVLVHEIRYRMTLKPGIRQRKGEAFEAYLERIAEEYAARPDHYLAEEIARRNEDDFLRLEQELWTWAEQIRAARRTGVWPRNSGQCHEYGGCRFLPLCAREPGAEHQYVVREKRTQEVQAA